MAVTRSAAHPNKVREKRDISIVIALSRVDEVGGEPPMLAAEA
jgi:hypothetical protein